MKARMEKTKQWGTCLLAGLFVAGLVYVQGCHGKSSSENTPSTSTTTTTAQTTFATAAEAGQALQTAAKAHDEGSLARILGPSSKAILSSGDPVEDKAALDSFAAEYDQMNRWVAMTDGSQILNIGLENYPFPIPLAKDSSSKWYFNTKAGEDEILARQIGRNELLAVDATSAIGNAEELYFKQTRQYTHILISTPGKQDGLYWEVPAGQVSSPLGNLNDFAKKRAHFNAHRYSSVRWLSLPHPYRTG